MVADSFRLRNRQLLVAAKRYTQLTDPVNSRKKNGMTIKLTKQILILFLFLQSSIFGQTQFEYQKESSKKQIEAFKQLQMTTDSLKYIDTYFFEELLNRLNSTNIPILSEVEKGKLNLHLTIGLNSSDTSFLYTYSSWKESWEYYYKNCSPSNEKFNWESNLVYSSCNEIKNLVEIKTINEITITKPTRAKYDVYVCTCPRSPSKSSVTNEYIKKILGQYQLRIDFSNGTIARLYFVAPPRPTDKFRFKYSYGNF
jgi:hypothetical protein